MIYVAAFQTCLQSILEELKNPIKDHEDEVFYLLNLGYHLLGAANRESLAKGFFELAFSIEECEYSLELLFVRLSAALDDGHDTGRAIDHCGTEDGEPLQLLLYRAARKVREESERLVVPFKPERATKRDTKSDIAKKNPENRGRRKMNSRAWECANKYRAEKGHVSMAEIAKSICEERHWSFRGTMRILNDNPDTWKNPVRRATKRDTKSDIRP